MLTLFNSHGKVLQSFKPALPDRVTLFTCGPSVYQPSHIGNHRTFLFEDMILRYLEFSGYTVIRGMTVTDVEDKAIEEAVRQSVSLDDLSSRNLQVFLAEMDTLAMKRPDHLPRASQCIEETVFILQSLIRQKRAYLYKGNVYFDPLTFPGFGSLYGLDMSGWPSIKKRFHKDTYPGMRWNRGDFVLWHGWTENTPGPWWDTSLGRGRPAWNVQDPSMIMKFFDETLSIYCGGIDNLVRHHDYSRAILESIRPYPMAKYWLHGHHLLVNGRKMSKSKGNIVYLNTLLNTGYSPAAVRLMLINRHYRQKLNYTERMMENTADRLKMAEHRIAGLKRRAGRSVSHGPTVNSTLKLFASAMDQDLNTPLAIDNVFSRMDNLDIEGLTAQEAAGWLTALKKIDGVLNILF